MAAADEFTALANPVINGPYEPPAQHFELDAQGSPTGVLLPGRRPSESSIPIAPVQKGQRRKGGVQSALVST